jgi:hypothetical protein
MDSDEEDYVFHGTPIEREEEFTSRKKKAIAEASGNLRSLPVWKQEVRLKLLTLGSHFPPLVWFLGKLRIVKPKEDFDFFLVILFLMFVRVAMLRRKTSESLSHVIALG